MVMARFFSESYVDHRDLHSFPTRRSSDLALDDSSALVRAVAVRGVSRALAESARLDRSEEHTSELQSRLHLVCRLLLEKKKKHECINEIITNMIEKNKKVTLNEITTTIEK